MAAVRYLVVVMSFVSSLYAFAQPAYDLCDNAAPLGVGSLDGSSTGATGSETTPCSLNDTADVWYVASVPARSLYTISVTPANFDVAIALYDACGGTLLDCDDSGPAGQTNVVSGANPGSADAVVWVRIAGSNNSTGDFTLSLDVEALPANDACADATPLAPGTTSGTSIHASGTDVSTCSLNDTADVWYAVALPANHQASIAVTPAGFDASIALLDSCGGALLDCDDSGPPEQTNTVFAVNRSNNDQDLRVRIAGVNGATGEFALSLTLTELPANDACENAVRLHGGANASSNLNATGDTVSVCSLNDTADVWYLVRAPGRTTARVSVSPADFDASIAIYDACGGNEFACDDSGAATNTNTVSATNTGAAPVDFFVRVAGVNGATGTYTLDYALLDAEPDTAGTLLAGYAQFAAAVSGPVNDIDNNGICDTEELTCFAALVGPGGDPALRFAYLSNRAQAALDLGDQALAEMPNLDAVLGAWITLGETDSVRIVLSIDACTGCNKVFNAAAYDQSQVAAAYAGLEACNAPFCAPGGTDLAYVYERFANAVENHGNDIDRDGTCDLAELQCFAELRASNPAVEAVFQYNAAQAAADIGLTSLYKLPQADQLAAAWVMLGKAWVFDIVLGLDACVGCNKDFTTDPYDLSQNGTVATAIAACDVPPCGIVGEGEGQAEGASEGEGEGENEGASEGEGEGDGEGELEGQVEGEQEPPHFHSADRNKNWRIELSEILRVLQLFNSGTYHCQDGTEDGYALGAGSHECAPHDADYLTRDWHIDLSELLRVISFYNSPEHAYHASPGSEDGFAPGAAL